MDGSGAICELIYACGVIRRLFRDSAIYALSGLVSQGIAFLLFPFLAHTLRPREYGVIDIVSVLTTLVLLTVALEISQGLGRMVGLSADRGERSAYASTAFIWSVVSYTVFAAVALVLARPITDALLGKHIDVWITRTAIGGIWVAGALYLLQDQLRWQLRPLAFAAVSAVVAAVTAAATAVYVFAMHGGALGVVGGQLTGATAGLVTALALSRGIYRWRFDRAKARTMLIYSIPLVPSSVGVLLNGYADRLAIQHQESLAAVGTYGVGFRVAVVVSLLLVGVQGALTPQVLARHREPDTPAELARALRLFWAVGCVTFVVLSVLAEPLVRLLAAPTYFGAARVVPLLVPAAFLAGLYVFAPGPNIAGRMRGFAIVNVVSGALNLGLAFALVPSFGIRGAGIATVISSAVAFVAMMAISQPLYRVPHDWQRLAAGALIATAVVVVTRTALVTQRVDAFKAGPLLARLAICACAAVLVTWALVDWRALAAVIARARGR